MFSKFLYSFETEDKKTCGILFVCMFRFCLFLCYILYPLWVCDWGKYHKVLYCLCLHLIFCNCRCFIFVVSRWLFFLQGVCVSLSRTGALGLNYIGPLLWVVFVVYVLCNYQMFVIRRHDRAAHVAGYWVLLYL